MGKILLVMLAFIALDFVVLAMYSAIAVAGRSDNNENNDNNKKDDSNMFLKK